ncbi:MAG TPA: pyridoxamine 5'-phosphate oxidase family protein [Thermomicrobiales bacterium]
MPEHADGLLPWSHAAERLTSARNYWIVTADQRGQPHAMPVWGVWIGDALYFSTGTTTRTARNLAVNPRAAVHLESGSDVVTIEGAARFEQPIDPETAKAIDDAMAEKYDFRPSADGDSPENGMFVLRPRVAFAWTQFPADATRWKFAERSE